MLNVFPFVDENSNPLHNNEKHNKMVNIHGQVSPHNQRTLLAMLYNGNESSFGLWLYKHNICGHIIVGLNGQDTPKDPVQTVPVIQHFPRIGRNYSPCGNNTPLPNTFQSITTPNSSLNHDEITPNVTPGLI